MKYGTYFHHLKVALKRITVRVKRIKRTMFVQKYALNILISAAVKEFVTCNFSLNTYKI